MDSILIDEARTPLVISGATEDKSDQYFVCNNFIKQLEKSDYELDEKDKNVMLSEKGIDKIEKLSQTYGILKNNNFFDPQNINLVHHINQALKDSVFGKNKPLSPFIDSSSKSLRVSTFAVLNSEQLELISSAAKSKKN